MRAVNGRLAEGGPPSGGGGGLKMAGLGGAEKYLSVSVRGAG